MAFLEFPVICTSVLSKMFFEFDYFICLVSFNEEKSNYYHRLNFNWTPYSLEWEILLYCSL